MNERLSRIRESEKKSHTEIYTNEKLYDTSSWLAKPIKTVQEISSRFSDYESLRILDLGAGVGRNSIYLAKQFRSKDCTIDCVDFLDIAIEKLNQNASMYGVADSINGIVKTIEEYDIAPDTYDLIMAVSALEHVDSESSFIAKLKEIARGTKAKGIVCLVMNSEICEIDAETSEVLDPQFEVNLPTSKIQAILKEIFTEWSIIKESVSFQEYDIPRDDITSRLTTNVVTYVAYKGRLSQEILRV